MWRQRLHKAAVSLKTKQAVFALRNEAPHLGDGSTHLGKPVLKKVFTKKDTFVFEFL